MFLLHLRYWWRERCSRITGNLAGAPLNANTGCSVGGYLGDVPVAMVMVWNTVFTDAYSVHVKSAWWHHLYWKWHHYARLLWCTLYVVWKCYTVAHSPHSHCPVFDCYTQYVKNRREGLWDFITKMTSMSRGPNEVEAFSWTVCPSARVSNVEILLLTVQD